MSSRLQGALIDCCSLDESNDVYLYCEITRTGPSVESVPEGLYYFDQMRHQRRSSKGGELVQYVHTIGTYTYSLTQ